MQIFFESHVTKSDLTTAKNYGLSISHIWVTLITEREAWCQAVTHTHTHPHALLSLNQPTPIIYIHISMVLWWSVYESHFNSIFNTFTNYMLFFSWTPSHPSRFPHALLSPLVFISSLHICLCLSKVREYMLCKLMSERQICSIYKSLFSSEEYVKNLSLSVLCKLWTYSHLSRILCTSFLFFLCSSFSLL